MAKQISVLQARENLRSYANEIQVKQTKPGLLEAKKKLLRLDDEIDLPFLVPYVEKGIWKDAFLLSLVWSTSEEGLKMLSPFIKKYITFKILQD